ncbi:hypothetical protein PMI06_003230 [Burkholderia sp. BT03]|nr:hypothetical protein PMI06_003230 [Burkholderia sp. BT03]SKC60254.1 hypothetical protein SAMN06266956_1102 [Paraburkholderia hospita]
MKRGDTFSIETSKGQAYFQFSRNIAPMGPLIRVLPGIYSNESPAWEMLVEQETNFWIFSRRLRLPSKGLCTKLPIVLSRIMRQKSLVFGRESSTHQQERLRLGG